MKAECRQAERRREPRFETRLWVGIPDVDGEPELEPCNISAAGMLLRTRRDAGAPGACLGDPNYNSPADADTDGCVTNEDVFLLFPPAVPALSAAAIALLAGLVVGGMSVQAHDRKA